MGDIGGIGADLDDYDSGLYSGIDTMLMIIGLQEKNGVNSAKFAIAVL